MEKLTKGTHILTATKDADIETVGLNKRNCTIVFTNEKPVKSWEPGRDIQQIKQIKEGKKYLVKLKAAVDLSEYLTNGEV